MAGWVSERKKILQSRQILKVLHVRAFTLKLLSSMLMISYYLDSWHHSSRGFCRFSHDTASTFLKTFSPRFPCSGARDTRPLRQVAQPHSLAYVSFFLLPYVLATDRHI